MLELFRRSGMPFEVCYNHTTVDAPPTIYHIKKKFEKLEEQGIKCSVVFPKYKGQPISMWSLIIQKKIPPTRVHRYCCKVLKESGGRGRFIATGVRWQESRARQCRNEFETITSRKEKSTKVSSEIMLSNDNDKRRRVMEHCKLKSTCCVNPIIDWSNRDIWTYLRNEKIDYNPLYDNGYWRIGCIGCPMAGKRRFKEFADFPKYKVAYIKTFDKMLMALKANKDIKRNWKNGNDIFNWWMKDKNIEGQLSLFDTSTQFE